MTTQAFCINIKPNLSFTYEFYVDLNKNWELGVANPVGGSKQEFKKNVIKEITKVLKFEPYLKLYFYKYKTEVYPSV